MLISSVKSMNVKRCFLSSYHKRLKVFRYSFSEAIPIFFNRLKSVFSLFDRYKMFTSNWLSIEICENVVLSKIDITTTINKTIQQYNNKQKTLKLINAEFWVI